MKPKKIILIIIDSLRKDHLSCYGYKRNTSPNIDALAESGILFKHTFSVCPNTVPSLASILTSRHPGNHSIGFDPEGRLNAQADRTLASILKENNCKTAAFSGRHGLSGLDTGFDIFDDAQERRNCQATNEKIFNWLDVNHMHDFFMFVHYFDAHGPNVSPEPHKNMFLNDEFYGPPEYIQNISDNNDIRHYRAQYDGCIRYIDDNIGKFMEKLRKLNIYEDSLIIITSDHGVSLGENNVFLENGLSVTLDQIAVPLIIKPYKGMEIKPGERNIHISNIDIMPTILSLYEYKYEELGLEGHSLKNILEDKKDAILEERTLTCENEYHFALIYSNKLMEIKTKDSPTSKNYPKIISLIDALNGKKYYWDSGQDYYMSISFDQYQRYRLISDIINKFRNDKKTFKILDVGASFEENLKKFLPYDDIYYLDIDYPPEYKQRTNFIIGDITKLELDETYDFVISVDTYEHIPANSREKFINNLLNLSRIATIIAAPFDTPGVRENEILANELYKLSHGTEYVWLHEHIQNGLPSLTFTIELVKKSGFKYAVIPNGYLPRWFEMISTFLLTEGMPEFSKSMEELNEFYNKNFYLLDNLNPAYRQAIVISKSDTKMDLSDIHSNDPKSDKEFNIKYEMLQSFIKNIKDFYSNHRYKELKDKELKEKDKRINEFAEAIKARDVRINELKSTIQSKDARISGLNNAIQSKDTQISGLNNAIQTRDDQISGLNNAIRTRDEQISELNNALIDILQSVTWRTVKRFHKVMEKLFPQETGRRKLYDLGIKGIRSIVNVGFKKTISNFNEYWHSSKKIKIADNNETSGISNNNEYQKGRGTDKQYILDLLNRASQKSSEYVPLSQNHINITAEDIKLIAFYLPQYHPIPENDRFWGKGFTDWRNVAKAVPQFNGHYQPKLPDELGFYDLRVHEVLKRQIELANQYGIYGFCFHYYWFNGKRLLEKPLNQFLNNPGLNLKFCVCWANENWTRRWDGLEKEILIDQAHSIENDIAFIKDLEPIFRDPRYIRIGARPVLIVYRATLLPEPNLTAQRWREYCRQQGIGEIYLIAAQSFNFTDPRPYGFDAAVEFPPHNNTCGNINNKIKFTNEQFSGNIYDIEDYIKSKISIETPPYKLFKTVFPGWDNTARRPNNASVFLGSSPEVYKKWLSNAVKFAKLEHSKEEIIVFINAWNEWAEGAYLEPDLKYGYSYLQATSEVVLDNRLKKKKDNGKIIFVSHDAFYAGAQLISLNIIKMLKELFHYDVFLILKSGGQLEEEFKKYSTVYNLEKDFASDEIKEELIQTFYDKGANIAICNTIISGDIIELFHKHNIQTISLIHELPGVINEYKMEKNSNIVAQYADKIIFPSEFVKAKFASTVKLDEKKCVIASQGLYLKNNFKEKKEEARSTLRKLLSIQGESKIVLGIGYAYFRKGVDLFVQVAKNVVKSDPDTHFIWVGQWDENFMKDIIADINTSGYQNNIHFMGLRKDVDLFYAGADLYLMTSREDPFPSTILEAMDVGVPVIGFQDAGGFKDVITNNTGILVPYLDVNEMTTAVISLLNDTQLRTNLGKNASELIRKKYNFTDYVYHLLKLLGHEYKKVSIIIPNYNYERYLEERIRTVVDQTYPVYEIIFLDDCSSDNSIQVAKNWAKKTSIPFKIINNNVNSGSVSKQWAKGIGASSGEYIWIAEADDLSEPSFLKEVMSGFNDDKVVLSYTQSKQIDQDGLLMETDYLKYTNDIDENKWKEKYIREGIQEISDTLVIKNTIPNVSAVVFKKYDISEILNELVEYKIAGDWFFYIWLLQKGKISFNPKSLNCHRRHDKGVTISENSRRHFDEILRMQEYVKVNFDITDTTIKKAYSYRNYLKEYFHL